MRLKVVSAAAMALALTAAGTGAQAQVRTPVTEARAAQSLSPAQRDAVLNADKAAKLDKAARSGPTSTLAPSPRPPHAGGSGERSAA